MQFLAQITIYQILFMNLMCLQSLTKSKMILGKLSVVKISFLLSNDNDDVFSQFRMGSFTKEREKRAISLNVILIGMKRIFSLMIEHIVALKITRCCYYYVLMVFLCYPSLVFHSSYLTLTLGSKMWHRHLVYYMYCMQVNLYSWQYLVHPNRYSALDQVCHSWFKNLEIAKILPKVEEPKFSLS